MKLSGIRNNFVCFLVIIMLFAIACKSQKTGMAGKKTGKNMAWQLERDSLLKELEKLKGGEETAYSNALKNSLKDALTGFNADELNIEVRDGKVYVSMSDKLLFRSGSATVEDKGKNALRVLANVLEKNQQVEILVEGHTDNLPIKTAVYKDNWDLSTARAANIVRILSSDYKITASRLSAAGRGEYHPIANNKTPEGRAKNRRTEIILSPKLDALYKILE
ncbi:MAG: hypothetical protein EOP53_07145 [Sphingobacteriales bacterium]|nr:MAG: hypothetical protein EOP53_07145 [Sphingobacteriales bacterium]